MHKGLRISVVIPTLNEAKGIEETIRSVPAMVDEIVVVDGNSTDGTRDIAAKMGAKVVLEARRGYGRAFRTGFEHCTGDIIATTDGDGTYPIELLPQVLEDLLNKELEFVSCSRFPLQDPKAMKTTNFLGNYAMTMAASTLWLHRFNDILSGMWVFRRRCLSQLRLLSNSWNLSEEIKLEAYRRLRGKFAEYPIPYRERLGDTKLMPWKVGLQNIGYMFTLRTGTTSRLGRLFGA